MLSFDQFTGGLRLSVSVSVSLSSSFSLCGCASVCRLLCVCFWDCVCVCVCPFVCSRRMCIWVYGYVGVCGCASAHALGGDVYFGATRATGPSAAPALAERYGVTEFPTLLVIDSHSSGGAQTSASSPPTSSSELLHLLH